MCEGYIDWLPLARSRLGPWPITQACALTGNRTGNLLVCRQVLSLLSHTSQDHVIFLYPSLVALRATCPSQPHPLECQ